MRYQPYIVGVTASTEADPSHYVQVVLPASSEVLMFKRECGDSKSCLIHAMNPSKCRPQSSVVLDPLFSSNKAGEVSRD